MNTSKVIVGVVSLIIVGVIAYLQYPKKNEALTISSIASDTCGGKNHVKRVHLKGFECR